MRAVLDLNRKKFVLMLYMQTTEANYWKMTKIKLYIVFDEHYGV